MFVDEYGRPIIVLREQDKKARVKGAEARKVWGSFCNATVAFINV